MLAGLQIDERHAHFYYIDRYPLGRDATVFSNGSTVWDMRFTNDTAFPIVIRSWTTYGSPSSITVQLWSWPLHRTVAWKSSGIQNRVLATNKPPKYVNTLHPGQTLWEEYPVDGFKITVGRTVTDDATGAVLHRDTWVSVYIMMKGQVQIGGPPPTPTPTGGVPTPTATLPPEPTPTIAPTPRRRRVA